MQRVLFHDTIFGPIHSRRLGSSLGVNLSPNDGKICSFDCLYCEAGFNAQGSGTTGFPSREAVREQLRARLEELKAEGQPLDVITFSGNGEPTLHPDFPGIIDDVIALRDELFPQVKISVLTNSTMLKRPEVCTALRKVDNNILKLDSAVEQTMRRIDRPGAADFTVERVIGQLEQFAGSGIIQTMILRGEGIDNTSDEEIDALIGAYKRIRPRSVMIYSIDRKTPDETLRAVSHEELAAIAARMEAATGIPVTTT